MEAQRIISAPSKELNFPSIGRLFAYFLISLLLTTWTSSTTSTFRRLPAIPSVYLVCSFLILAVIVYTTLSLILVLKKRHESRRIFIDGKVPMLESESLLSGNLFTVVRPGNNLEIIHQHHARLGKTFGMFFGPDPWVFTTDLELIYRLFVSEGNKYVNATQFRLPYLDEVNHSLAQANNDHWRRSRRILNPSFTAHQMKSDNVHRDIQTSCIQLLDCIQAHAPCQDSGSRLVDLQYAAQKFAANVILKVAYGQEDIIDMRPNVKDQLIEAIRDGAKVIMSPVACASIIFGGKVQYLFGLLAGFTAVGKSIRQIHELVDDSFRKRVGATKARGSSERRLIDTLIECFKFGQMDERTLRANLFFVFIAGFDTTANTLTCLLWRLAKHPTIQDKLRDSLALAGEQSQYLDWCIRETLRLYPAVPTAIGRVLSDDITFGERKFFKGTTINASIFSIHRSSEYWGQDVDAFKPERFDEQQAGQLHPAQYMPFALGPRICIGQNLAMAEMRALVARIILKYKLEMCESTPTDLTYTSTNLVHMIIDGPVDLKFTEISSL